ncbi:MAG: cardiolipin synthase [Clostridia bacterium]|nr:cardiolipin synthase [Clostridia bacterium]
MVVAVIFLLRTIGTYVGISLPWTTIYNAFNRFVGVYIFLIAIFIFFESKDPSRTLAWLLVLALLPSVGFFLYLFLGNDIRKRIRTKDKKTLHHNYLERAAHLQQSIAPHIDFVKKTESRVDDKLIRLLLKNSSSPFSINNEVKVLKNGEETFDVIIDALKSATKFIHMEYFIIRDDRIGKKIRDLLVQKAKEGVAVRIIYDSVGCWKLTDEFFNPMKEAGVEFYPFLPVMAPLLSRELNYRNHRKIIVVDGVVGFVGGLNIGVEYLGEKELGFWRDTHLRLKGDSVYSLQNIFLNDWYFASDQALFDEAYFPEAISYGDKVVQVTSSGPDSDWFTIHQAYFTMITTAEKRVWLVTPYLVPDKSLQLALKTAALSGLDVRIIIPNKPDHFFVYWASRDNIQELLEAGVRIFTYEQGFIHSKVLVVDDVCASVGTANFDIRSLEINYEVNAFIYDHDVVEELANDFRADLKYSKEISLVEHLKRPLREKFLEAMARLVSPLQ